MQEGDSIPLLQGIFHLTLVHNTGIAFGFFNRHPSILFVLITASLFVLTWLGWKISKDHQNNKIMESSVLSRIGLSLILGGALGNWIDRLRFQAVIDFLDFRVWPVFNIADSAITMGVGLYLFLLIRGNTAHKENK